MPRKVFISYKRKSDAIATGDSEALADAVRARLEADGYEVFIDKKIEGGSLWNTVIAKNLAACDGAIALLSEGALASEWVRHELSVLSHRWRTSEPSFPFQIVALSDEIVARLSEAPFNAMGIGSGEALVPAKKLGVAPADNEFADQASLLAMLSGAFAKVLPARRDAAHLQLERLRLHLRKFPSVFEQLEDLFASPPASSDTESRVGNLAECLLAATSAQLIVVVQILKSSAEADGPQGPPVNLKSLIDLVFPNWVRPEAAATLALAAQMGRFGALNAQLGWTFTQYLRRAERSPNNHWQTVELHDVGSELSCVDQAARLIANKHLGGLARAKLDGAKAAGSERFAAVADEKVGDAVYFPIVTRVQEAEELLALGRRWVRPFLKGEHGPAELGERGVRLLPLLTDEEEADRQDYYDVLMQQLEPSNG